MIPRPGYDLDVNPVEPDYSADEVADLLSQGEPAIKVPGLQRLVQRREPHLLIDGEAWTLPARIRPPSRSCATRTSSPGRAAELADQAGFLQLLTRLVNRGYWFFG
jgi:50S ribosomal protein L16 3-hydroxylase